MHSTQRGTRRVSLFSLFATFFLFFGLSLGAGAQTPLTFGQTFSPVTVGPGSTARVTFAITNNSSSPITGMSFTDTLPQGLEIAAAPAITNSCGFAFSSGGAAGDSDFGVTAGSVGGSSSCQLALNVVDTGLAAATFTNLTGALGSSAGSGGTSSATTLSR